MSKLPKAAQDNRANQLNQNNPAYQSSRGLPGPGQSAKTPIAPQAPRQVKQPEPAPEQGGKKP
jgi:hypothetical protein